MDTIVKPPQPAKQVAVLVVHGVAAKEPNDALREVYDVMTTNCQTPYLPTKVENLRLPVEKVKFQIGKLNEASGKRKGLFQVFDQRSNSVRARQSMETAKVRPENPNHWNADDDIARDYMVDQLMEYVPQGTDCTYETLRLESVRTPREGITSKVHFHELFWADLSRGNFSVFQGFIELYQVLFDVCGLGRSSLNFALAARPADESLKRFKGAHALAEWLLVFPIPILNLSLLMLAGLLLPVRLNASTAKDLFVSGSLLLLTTAISALCYRWREKFAPESWLIGFLGIMLAASVAVYELDTLWNTSPSYSYCVAAVPIWLLALTAFLWLMNVYREYRRGAFLFACVVALLVTALLMFELFGPLQYGPAGAPRLADDVLRCFEAVLEVLVLTWMCIFIAVVSVAVLGQYAVCLYPTGDISGKVRFRRMAWTVNLSVLVPSLLLLIMTLGLWKAAESTLVKVYNVSQAGGGALLDSNNHVSFNFQIADLAKLTAWISDKPMTDKAAVQNMMESSSYLLDRAVFPLSIAFVIAVWSLLPVVITEVVPPLPVKSADMWKKSSQWLGRCLTQAFFNMRIGGELLRALVIILFIDALLAGVIDPFTDVAKAKGLLKILFGFNEERNISSALLTALGVAIVAMLLGRGPLQFLVLGFRAFLIILIDVINWLRLRPLSRNPRARISARYVSMLRHLCAWRDPQNGRGYEAVIIVAHSQGTVVSADILRFIHAEPRMDPQLNEIYSGQLPVDFFTMGCPLRQLYSLRFPDLYRWVRQDDDASTLPQSQPTFGKLGVRSWVNCYRTGDYVGRQLWTSDAAPSVWNPSNLAFRCVMPQGKQTDVCLGPGSHTHYWDTTSSDFSDMLDRVIALA